MKQRSTRKKYSWAIWLISGVLVFVLFLTLGFSRNKTTQTKSTAVVKNTPATVKNTTSNSAATITPTQTGGDTTSTPGPIPIKPVLSKSSGNNGPVPIGVNMNFVCMAEKGVECSIVLVLDGKQTVLGPTTTQEDGFGKYYALFTWATTKGTYEITAQAKNSQGGTSTSIPQALEVQ